MSYKTVIYRLVLLGILLAVMLFIVIPDLHAQAKQILSWQKDLAYLQTASKEELMLNEAAVRQIRNGIEFWLKFHPSSKAVLQSAPPEPWGVEEIRKQVSALSQTVETILKEDPSRPFNLGVIEVSVTAEASPLSPVTESLSRDEMANRQILTVAQAIDTLPGVTIDQPNNPRNEAQGRIRGFSMRGQVPLYLDGIPVYVPYDGYVDLNRFLTSDIAEVQVAKGYSSPLLGPNSLGGSINLVTKQPDKKLESDALIGTGSGNMIVSSLRLGSRWRPFYVQGSVDYLQKDYFPLSGNFTLNNFQNTYQRNLSDTRDEKYSARAAWTPKEQDQYSFSYITQKGKKNGLQYIGPNSKATYNRFWKWPYWNKTGYYLITNTGIGDKSSIKFRAYYDQFQNSIDMFDDAKFATMKKSNSEHSNYDEHTDGASSEFTTRLFSRNTISASIFFKDDTHKEGNLYPGRAPYPLISPTLILRDQQVSIGLQDAISLTSRLRVTVGFSADHLKGLTTSAYNSASTALLAVKCFTSPDNESFSGCTAHVWSYNPQVSASYTLTNSDTLFAVFSDRSRFPLLKESYSYRLGSAMPNPDLKPEHSRNWNVGYSHTFASRTLMQIEYFRSDLRDAIQSVYRVDPGYPLDPLCPSNNSGATRGYCSQMVNIGKEVHEGVEFSIRSTPVSRLALDASYSYLNRTLAYDFGRLIDVSQVNTAISPLPSMPKNKFIGNVTVSLPYQVLGLVSYRYEGGILLQDTTYSPAQNAFGTSFGIVDVGTAVPIRSGVRIQTGIKNLLDRNYYYTAGYPEAGRHWYFDLRYQY